MGDEKAMQVEHDEAERQFIINRKDGKAALYYEYVNTDTVDLQHTVVDDKLRGKGYGDILAQAALNFALRNKLKIRLSCSFLSHYALKNSLSKAKFRIVD